MKYLTSTLFALAFSISAVSADDHGEKKELPAAAKQVTVSVTPANIMAYDIKAIEMKAGETVTITLDNKCGMPKVSMGHNLVILKPGVDLMGFAAKGIPAGLNKDYMPQDDEGKAQIVAATKMLGTGEKDAITVTLKEAGKYEYLCTFPGHAAIMRGVITVK